MSDLSNALSALRIANKRIDELEKYNLDLANESHNKSARIERLKQRVGELELQVRATALLQDETAAQNESLGEALHQALIHWSAMGVKDEDGLAYDECEKRLNQSPKTSLAEHDYRDGGAAQKAFWEGFESGAINGAVNIRSRWEEYKSVQYAKRVKDGE